MHQGIPSTGPPRLCAGVVDLYCGTCCRTALKALRTVERAASPNPTGCQEGSPSVAIMAPRAMVTSMARLSQFPPTSPAIMYANTAVKRGVVDPINCNGESHEWEFRWRLCWWDQGTGIRAMEGRMWREGDLDAVVEKEGEEH